MRSSFLTIMSLGLVLGFGIVVGNAQGSAPVTNPTPSKAKTFVFSRMSILNKPNAGYTEAARTNRVEGVVRLMVMFRSTGEIGDVTVVAPLPHGLTERAVEAARQIRFTPKKLNGVPMDEQTVVEYNFRLYYENDDADIRSKVEILSTPKPSLIAADLPASFSGKLSVKVFFSARGNASVFEIPNGLTAAAKTKIEDAVKRIKFRPAIHSNGTRMSVTKEIIYAF